MIEDLFPDLGIGIGYMLLNHAFQFIYIEFGCHMLDIYQLLIHIPVQAVIQIQYVRHAAAHSCRKVLTGLSKNRHASTRHILASMISYAFHYGRRA